MPSTEGATCPQDSSTPICTMWRTTPRSGHLVSTPPASARGCKAFPRLFHRATPLDVTLPVHITSWATLSAPSSLQPLRTGCWNACLRRTPMPHPLATTPRHTPVDADEPTLATSAVEDSSPRLLPVPPPANPRRATHAALTLLLKALPVRSVAAVHAQCVHFLTGPFATATAPLLATPSVLSARPGLSGYGEDFDDINAVVVVQLVRRRESDVTACIFGLVNMSRLSHFSPRFPSIRQSLLHLLTHRGMAAGLCDIIAASHHRELIRLAVINLINLVVSHGDTKAVALHAMHTAGTVAVLHKLLTERGTKSADRAPTDGRIESADSEADGNCASVW
eukprot:m.546803 g.546803  ORF g.546803 m.546803 type:complete len:337 (-) comp22155_c0_seq30:3588-4598(-)